MTVAIRPLREDDAELVVVWRRRPDVHAQLFAQEPPTLEGHRRWFQGYQAGTDREEFLIVDGDRPVGTVGLSRIDHVNHHAEYGILLGESDARGRGVARAASSLILARAFGPLRLTRAYLHVFPDNAAAIALYERLGFRHEGVLREHAVKDGAVRDVLVMGLLAREASR